MNKKGTVTQVDNINKIARVVFPDMDDAVSYPLKILSIAGDLSVNDTVVVSFFSRNFADGVILGKIGGAV